MDSRNPGGANADMETNPEHRYWLPGMSYQKASYKFGSFWSDKC